MFFVTGGIPYPVYFVKISIDCLHFEFIRICGINHHNSYLFPEPCKRSLAHSLMKIFVHSLMKIYEVCETNLFGFRLLLSLLSETEGAGIVSKECGTGNHLFRRYVLIKTQMWFKELLMKLRVCGEFCWDRG